MSKESDVRTQHQGRILSANDDLFIGVKRKRNSEVTVNRCIDILERSKGHHGRVFSLKACDFLEADSAGSRQPWWIWKSQRITSDLWVKQVLRIMGKKKRLTVSAQTHLNARGYLATTHTLNGRMKHIPVAVKGFRVRKHLTPEIRVLT